MSGMWSDLDRPPLQEAALRRALAEREGAFWRRLEVVPETGSTNADLLGRANDPSADRSVLLAEFQRSGRGRHARKWVTPPRAAIMASTLVRLPGVPVGALGWAPLLTGLALADALAAAARVEATLKWPNDLLVGGRKVAGILAELATTVPEPVVVIGFGLNVSQRADEFPDTPLNTPTSLALAGAEVTDRDTLARATLRSLGSRLSDWLAADGDARTLARDYRQRSATLGRQVRATMPGGSELTGTAVDVDADGRLLVRPDGAVEPVAISAGDITHLRATS
jgi:BirA family biotin operon repressor/biotin-[acetyl-CoA-carboxylase] ligase